MPWDLGTMYEFSFHTPPSLPPFTIYGWAVTASGRVYEKEWTSVTNRTEEIIKSYADADAWLCKIGNGG